MRYLHREDNFMIGGGSPDVPAVTPPPTTPQRETASRDARLSERDRARQRLGRQQTILTDDSPLVEEEETTTTRKTLLGT